METYPHIDEEPLPSIFPPELELAWRGLVISMNLAGLPRETAIQMMQEWGSGAHSSEAEHFPLKEGVEISKFSEPSNLTK